MHGFDLVENLSATALAKGGSQNKQTNKQTKLIAQNVMHDLE